jgi:twinkle protein
MKTFGDFGIDVPLGKSGEIDTQCPQCSALRKKKHLRCLGVNVEKGTWLCQHCGWAGGLGSGAYRNELHWRRPVYVRPEPKPAPDTLDVGLVNYFAKRGISAPVLRRNRISIQSVYMPQVEDIVRAICFPYYRGEEFVNAKYRDKDKNFRMEAGAERILYGLNDIDPKRCVIVEGEIDKLSMEEAGVTSCVSVPDGAPAINAKNYDSKFTFLDSAAEQLEAVREWIIAVDNDPPGTRLEEELVRRFGVEKCRRVIWPEGCKDANDTLVKYGPELLSQLVEHAEEFPIAGVVTASMLRKEIELLYAEGESRGVSTGWAEMDKHYTVQPGEITVITGTPGSGKSNWLDALLVNLARDQNWIVPMFSPENQPLRKHYARLMEKFIREPFRAGPTRRMTPERREEALQWVDFYFPMIAPDDESDWTLENIFSIASALVRRQGIKGMVIDPWNEIEHVRPPHLGESEYIGLSLRKVRQFARKHRIHVWIVAHPAKLYRNKDGTYPMPTLYDISGSANWFNKVDNGIVVYRDKGNPDAPVEVHVQKVRLRETGQIGDVKFKYNKVLADYDEMTGPTPHVDRWSPPQ